MFIQTLEYLKVFPLNISVDLEKIFAVVSKKVFGEVLTDLAKVFDCCLQDFDLSIIT